MSTSVIEAILLVGLTVAQASPAASQGADTMSKSATQFFTQHPNPIDFQQHADRLLLANRRIGLEFRQTAWGFRLSRLYGAADGQDFLAADDADNIFEIVTCLDPATAYQKDPARRMTSPLVMKTGGYEVMDDMAGQTQVIGPQSAKSVAFERQGDDKQMTLRLMWRQIDLPQDPKSRLDVEVSVTLKADDPLSYWRIKVANPSLSTGIERVRFPVVNLAPIGRAEDNAFIYPQDRGRLVRNPFGPDAGGPGFGDNLHIRCIYPSQLGMQFEALYNEKTGAGVYLGTFDPTPTMMDWQISNTTTHLRWGPGHFPPNIGFARQDFVLPYDCVIGPFHGDWYEACQIYRPWAVAQSWCAKGTLDARADIPKWFKETPLYLTANAEGRDEQVAMTRDHYLKYLKWAGVKLPCTWYTWKDYKPELTVYQTPYNYWRFGLGRRGAVENIHDGNYPKLPALPSFAAACKQLREAGGMVSPYVCLQIYDQGPSDNAPYVAEARPHIARDSFGYMLGFNYETSWRPCAWSPWWRDRLEELCVTMMQKESAMGFYLDVMHGCTKPCYWPHHGHSACGGSSMTVGMHGLSKHIRDAVKAADPEAITTGEDSTENMIDVIDGKLYQRTLMPTSGPPLFAAVYKDYITRHGMDAIAGPGDTFFMQTGCQFVEGAQIGRLYLDPWITDQGNYALSFDDPKHKEMVGYLGRLVAYYKQDLGRKFLCYGRLMRPLAFAKPDPMPTVSYAAEGGTYNKGIVELPALLSGVMLSGDGELGVFVLNMSGREVAFSADMDLARHGLTANATVSVAKVAPDGASSEQVASAKGRVTMQDTLGARMVAMYHVKPLAK